MGVPIYEVSESLDAGNHGRNRLLTFALVNKDFPDGLSSSQTELAQKLAAISKVNAEPFGNGKYELAVVYGGYDLIAQMVGQKENPLLMTRGAATSLPA